MKVVAVPEAEKSLDRFPVPTATSTPAALRVVSVDSEPDPGKNAVPVALALNEAVSDPLAGRYAEPVALAEKLPDNAPVPFVTVLPA